MYLMDGNQLSAIMETWRFAILLIELFTEEQHSLDQSHNSLYNVHIMNGISVLIKTSALGWTVGMDIYWRLCRVNVASDNFA